jgi:Undecaprenyl-phosphate galactose phosphotransferase WbaP
LARRSKVITGEDANMLDVGLDVEPVRRVARWHDVAKRGIDIVLTIAMLIFFAPLMVLIALIVRHDGGPAFFRHERIGRGGVPFKCIKYRTMRTDAQELLTQLLARDPAAAREWQRDFKLRNDIRITPIGRILRRTSLDELPQLFNVLKGEMSLVGPRPIVAEEVPRYGKLIDYYYLCRPGLTGLWQVAGRNDTGYTRRIAFDTQYVQQFSLWGDFIILAKTVVVILSQRGAY